MPACSGRLKGVLALVRTRRAAELGGWLGRVVLLLAASDCAPLRLVPQMGLQGVATDQGGAASWPYESAGGELVITPPEMPAVSDVGGGCCRWTMHACQQQSVLPSLQHA